MTQTRFSQDCLILSDVTKGFAAGGKRIIVLNEISYDFKPGVSYAITGVSGSGKSTLLHILAGFEPVDSGQVVWMGRPIEQCSDKELGAFRAQHLGFVFQFHYLLSEFTVLDNIMLPALKLGIKSKADIRKDAIEKLEILDIPQLAKKKASMISGGEKQRVAIARALINNPSIIMGDEPTGNLDSKNSQNVFNILKRLSVDHGLSLLVVTHDNDFARQTDRIIEMEDGRIIS